MFNSHIIKVYAGPGIQVIQPTQCGLTVEALSKIVADDILFLLFSRENKALHFICIVCGAVVCLQTLSFLSFSLFLSKVYNLVQLIII